MGIFDLFKNKDKGEEDTSDGKYMPKPKLPLDERFMSNFIDNGGKFIYCENNNEVLEAFDNILLENDWYESDAFCLNTQIEQKFDAYNLKFGAKESSRFFVGECEYLVANNGAILICSKQIKEKKLSELPPNFIILAATSQLVEDISEGLRRIKSKSKHKLPSNITTIKHFGQSKSDNFLNYGSTTKNLYLLLLEDL